MFLSEEYLEQIRKRAEADYRLEHLGGKQELYMELLNGYSNKASIEKKLEEWDEEHPIDIDEMQKYTQAKVDWEIEKWLETVQGVNDDEIVEFNSTTGEAYTVPRWDSNASGEKLTDEMWKNIKDENNIKSSKALEQINQTDDDILKNYISYAASVHDSEDFVSGKTSPAEAALEFIAKNPQYAKMGPKLVSSFNRETFIKLVDMKQNDGDQFQRYDLDEIADRQAPSSRYANANPEARHYDPLTTAQTKSIWGPATSNVLSKNTTTYHNDITVESNNHLGMRVN